MLVVILHVVLTSAALNMENEINDFIVRKSMHVHGLRGWLRQTAFEPFLYPSCTQLCYFLLLRQKNMKAFDFISPHFLLLLPSISRIY
jgi:hypothetical protein